MEQISYVAWETVLIQLMTLFVACLVSPHGGSKLKCIDINTLPDIDRDSGIADTAEHRSPFAMLCRCVVIRKLKGFRSLRTAWLSQSGQRNYVTYIQGQSPEPRVREYFYYIDHQGQLFLDDTKVKNFVTCFKEKKFLVFFFSRLRRNESGRYQDHFPFLSLCGRERNFLRCDDRPLVFTHLLQGDPGGAVPEEPVRVPQLLSFCGGQEKMTVPFQPASIYMHPGSGRVYHPCSERVGGVGLIRSALAIELSPFFIYPPEQSQSGQPTHFQWAGQIHKLTNELAGCFPHEKEDGLGEGGVD